MRRNIPRFFEGRYWNMMRVFMVDSAKEMCKLCKGRGNVGEGKSKIRYVIG